MQKISSTTIVNHRETHKLHRMALPYMYFLYIFALAPMVLMFVLMFIDTEGIKFQGLEFTFSNFDILVQSSTYVAFFNSLKFAVLTTIICIFFGYLIAYTLYRSKLKNKYYILLLLILPMWTNFLLRINALASIFRENNIISSIFGGTGIDIIGTDFAVLLAMVFTYLPFIVLPIFTSLEKVDPALEEAATDLGLGGVKKFWKVVVPLTMKGVVSGSIMVLLPCLSGFAIPKIIGDGNILLIGNIIEQSFQNMSYNIGSVLAIVVLIIILGSILLVNKFDKEGETLL